MGAGAVQLGRGGCPMPAEAGAQDAMSLCNYIMSVCPNICLYKLCVISGAMYCLTDAEREETFLLQSNELSTSIPPQQKELSLSCT